MYWINKIIWKRLFVMVGCVLGAVFLVTVPWVLGWIEIIKWILTKI